MDEFSISAPTTVFEVLDGTVREYEVTPESVGLERAAPDAIAAGTVEANLRIAQAILAGETGPHRDAVLLNAGAGLMVAGLAKDHRSGVELAAQTIDSGAVRAKVEQVREVSNRVLSQVEAS
jgi:anthranilate phosphoribosyltransferase